MALSDGSRGWRPWRRPRDGTAGTEPKGRDKGTGSPPVSPHLSGRCSSCWNCSAEPAAATAPAMARLREGHEGVTAGHVLSPPVTCVRPGHALPPASRDPPAARVPPVSRVFSSRALQCHVSSSCPFSPVSSPPLPRAGTHPMDRGAPGHSRPGPKWANSPRTAVLGWSAFSSRRERRFNPHLNTDVTSNRREGRFSPRLNTDVTSNRPERRFNPELNTDMTSNRPERRFNPDLNTDVTSK